MDPDLFDIFVREKVYLEYAQAFLDNLRGNVPVTDVVTSAKAALAQIKRDKNTFRCYSIAYPVFNEIYSEFYENGEKVIKREVLERLQDWAWMIWFQDAGRKSSRKAYLRTHKFGKEGSEIIADYFNSLDVDCNVHVTRGRYEIVFTNKGAYEFLKIIAKCLPPFIVDRLPPETNPS